MPPVQLILLLLFFNIVNSQLQSGSSLRLVHILFRHGDRSPTHTYPTDPYQEDAWPQGLGQLSTTGMKQLFSLGQFIRKRYIDTGYLSHDYKQTEMSVRSTNKDRTLMSASSLLAGLYPPGHGQKWNAKLQWQPIPIHTVALQEDFLYAEDCPVYNKLYNEMLQSPPMLELQETHRVLIDYMARHSGLNATLFDLFEIMNPLICESIYKMKQPAWLLVNDTIGQILKLKNLKTQAKFQTAELARLKGGPLLGRMLKNMRDLVTHNNITIKAFFFSGHDTNINSLLSTLKAFNNVTIPYAATVFVELHIVGSTPIVKVFYRNDTTKPPYLLHIPECGDPCHLAKLEDVSQSMIPPDPEAACCVKAAPRKTSGATIAVTLMTLVAVVVFVVLVTVAVLRVRKSSALHRYRPVSQPF